MDIGRVAILLYTQIDCLYNALLIELRKNG